MMQKKNLKKVFLIGVFLILLLFLLGGNVRAEEENDGIQWFKNEPTNVSDQIINWFDGTFDWLTETFNWDKNKDGVLSNIINGESLKYFFKQDNGVKGTIMYDHSILEGTLNVAGAESNEIEKYGAIWKFTIEKPDKLGCAGVATLKFIKLTNNSTTHAITVPNRIQRVIIGGWTHVYYVRLTEQTFEDSNEAAKITSLELPTSILIENKDTLKTCLQKCTNLTEIRTYVPQIDASEANPLGDPKMQLVEGSVALWQEPIIEDVILETDKISLKATDGVLYSGDETKLICYPKQRQLINRKFDVPEGVKIIEEYAFSNIAGGNTITLPTSIEEIKAHAFEKSSGIRYINFKPTSTPKLTKIGDDAFNGSGLTNITIPKSVETFGKNIFSECSSLDSVTFSSGGTQSKTIPDYMFNTCTSLKNVTLGNRFTTIGTFAFAGCTGLTSIDLSNIGVIGVSAFAGCSNLEVSNLLNVTAIGNQAFLGCKYLTEINIPKTIIIGDQAFAGCTGLTDITFGTLSQIGNQAFLDCTGLTNLEIPQSVGLIEDNAFKGCTNLKNVVLGQNVQNNIGGTVFENCNSDLVIYCTEENEDRVRALANAGNYSYIVYEITGGYAEIKKAVINPNRNAISVELLPKIYGYQVIKIGDNAFENANIKEIIFPEYLTTIGNQAFKGCTGITGKIDFKNTTGLTTIGTEAFMDCTGITGVIIPKTVTTIGERAFKGCTNLEYASFIDPSQLETVGDEAFDPGVVIWYFGDCDFDNCPGVLLVGDNTIPEIVAYITTTPSGATIRGVINQRGVGIYQYAITTERNEAEVTNWKEFEKDFSDNKSVSFVSVNEFHENGKVYIYAKDLMGHSNRYELDLEGIDEIAPIIEEINSENNNGITRVTITASDEGGSYLKRYCVTTESNISKLKDTDWRNFTGKESTQTVNIDLTENGHYYMYVEDGAGNLAASNGSIYGSINGNGIDIQLWDLDTYAPWIQELKVYTETGTIEAWIRDVGTGLAGYAIDTNSTCSENTEWIPLSGSYIEYIQEVVEVSGTYFLHVKDGQGNKATKQITNNSIIITDKTAPRIVFGDKTNEVVKVMLEDGSGIAGGAAIKYAYSSYGGLEPEYYTTANVVYVDGGKAYFEARGRSLSGDNYLWVKVEELKDSKGNAYDTNNLAVSPQTYIFTTERLQVNTALNYKIRREGQSATYTLSFAEPVEIVKGVEIERESNTGNAQYTATYSGSDYTWNIKIIAGEGNGTLGFRIPAEMFRSQITGNTFKRDVVIPDLLTIDNTPPEIFYEGLDKSCVRENGEAVYTVTTSEPVKLDIGSVYDVVVEQTSGEYLMCNDARVQKAPDDTTPSEYGADYGTKWLITIVGGDGNGEVFLRLPEGLFRDIVDNQSEAKDIREGNLTFDNTLPKIESISEPMFNFVNRNKTLEFNLVFNEEIKYEAKGRTINVKVAETTNTDATVTLEPVNSTGLTRQFKVTVAGITGDGEVKITIPKEHFADIAGNELETDVMITGFKADNSGPVIGSIDKTETEENTRWLLSVSVNDLGIGLNKYVLSTEADVNKINATQWKTITETEKTNKKIENLEIDVKGIYYLHVKDLLDNVSYRIIDATTLTDIVPPEVKEITGPSVKIVNSLTETSYEVTMNEDVNLSNLEEDVTIMVGDQKLNNIMVVTEPTDLEGTIVLIEPDTIDKTKLKITIKGLTGNGIAKILIPKEYFKDEALNSMENDVELKGITVDNKKAIKTSASIDNTKVNSTMNATYTINFDEQIEYIKTVNDLKVIVTNSVSGETIEISAAVAIQPNTLTNKIKISVKDLTGNGTATLKIPEGFFKDVAGNLTDEILIEGLTIDNEGPVSLFEKINKTLTKKTDNPIVYTIKTNEPATLNDNVSPLIDSTNVGPTCKDITIAAANEEGTKWTVTLTECSGDGEISLVLPEGIFKDDIGNDSPYIKISDGNLVFDNTRPTIENLSETTTSFVNSNTTLEFIATMSEEIIYEKTSRDIEVKVGDIRKPATVMIEPILPSEVDVGEATDKFRIKITIQGLLGDGAAEITIPKEYFKDIAGNILAEDIVIRGMTVDNIIPRIDQIGGPSKTFVNASQVSEYTVLISEPITYLATDRAIKTTVNSQEISDVDVKITVDSINKKQVKVEVKGLTSNGIAKIVIPKEYFKDAAGNELYTDIELSGITVDNVSPIVKVDYTKTETGIKVTITGNEDLQLPDNTWTQVNPLIIEKEFTSDFYSQMDIKDTIGNITKTEVNAVFTTGIYMAETESEVVVSRTKQLAIETTPANAPFKDVVWSSSDESVATVNSNGLVTAKKVGETTITATLKTNNEVKGSCKIIVVERAIKSISVLTKPTKTEYITGQSLDLTGGKITVLYNDNSTENRTMLAEDVVVTGFVKTQVGTQTLTVTYANKTTTFNVNVIARALESISVKISPTETQYLLNQEDLNLAGGVLQLTYNDKQVEEIALTTQGIIVTGFDNTTLGKKTLTLTYQGKETTFEVEIVETKEPITTTFKENSEYGFSDGEYIVNISPQTKIEDFLDQITTNGELKVYEKGQIVTNTDGPIKTGMEIVITKGTNTKTYKLVVLGDVNGTGTRTVADITTMMMHLAETLAETANPTKILTGAYLKAANMNLDAKVTIADLTSLMKIIAENK